MPYDPLKDFAPLTLVGTSPLVLTAPVSQPGVAPQCPRISGNGTQRWGPNQWSYGTWVGHGGLYGTELLKSRSGINPCTCRMQAIPGRDAHAGRPLQMAVAACASAGASEGRQAAGHWRDIGGRSALAPDVPSLAEAGIQNFELEIWNAFAAPATMPKALQVRLATVLADYCPHARGARKTVPARLAGRLAHRPRGWLTGSRPIPQRWGKSLRSGHQGRIRE